MRGNGLEPFSHYNCINSALHQVNSRFSETLFRIVRFAGMVDRSIRVIVRRHRIKNGW